MERKFKGIWIPADIWESEALTLQEKVFLVEIDSLDTDEVRGCYANNHYFAKFFGISKTRVSLVIKSLIEKGFVYSTINVKEGNKRILKTSLTNVKDPLKQMLKHNNTINNTSNNTKNKDVIPFQEIIDYLNEKSGRKYRLVETTKKHIRARYAEEFDIDDFKKVIDSKILEWEKDAYMKKFIRPETLFGTKFPSYRAEAEDRIDDGETKMVY